MARNEPVEKIPVETFDGKVDDSYQPGDLESALKLAILKYLQDGHTHAETISMARKRRMRHYRQLRQLLYGEKVGSNRVYRGTLSKVISTLKANILGKLIPDSVTNDWLEVDSLWFGMKNYVEDIEALLRHKFTKHHTDNDKNFMASIDRELDDLFTFGTCAAVVNLEIVEGELNGDYHISSDPKMHRLDMFDCWPWAVDVDEISQTNMTYFSPITDDQLDILYPEMAEQIRKSERAITNKTDSRGLETQVLDKDRYPDTESFEKMYPRFIYYGRLPFRKIAEFIPSDVRDGFLSSGREGFIALASTIYDFDVDEALKANWWIMEFVGNTLCSCKPWPVTIPRNEHPVIWHTCFHINGQIWGNGMYDLSEIDERMMNIYHTAAIKLGTMAADPPIITRRSALDQQWLSDQGGRIKLKPGMEIPVVNETEKTPFEPLKIYNESLAIVDEQADKHEANQLQDTGVTSDIEGNAKSRTATQAANNIQQGMTLIEWHVEMFRANFMQTVAMRFYMAINQAFKILSEMVPGYYEVAPAGFAENRLRVAKVYPENIIDETWIQISVSGLGVEGNRMLMLNALQGAIQMYLPTGRLNIDAAMREHFRLMKFKNYKDIIANYDSMDPNTAVMNLLAAFGRDGLQYLPMELMQQLTGYNQLTPGPGAAGPPQAGVPGVEGAEGSPDRLPGLPNVPTRDELNQRAGTQAM